MSKAQSAIIEIDIHGQTKYQAMTIIDNQLRKAGSGIYRIRIIHGFHGGTELKDMIRSTYSNHVKVIRIESGFNEGITELVLRNF
ncbi:MAG: Smr/MutS family protein [Mobilitalea sp.]